MDKSYAKYLLDKTRKDYNLIAQEFSSARQNPWPEIKFLFDDYLTDGDKVLDLGCGNGRYFEYCKDNGIEYVGVDSSENLINIARKKYPEARFDVADAFSLSFPNDYFDKVYSIAVLHHIPSSDLRIRFLKEVKRILKKEGLLILTVWKFHQSKERTLFIKHFILKLIGFSKLDWNDIFEPWGSKVERYYHSFSQNELSDLLGNAGFSIIKHGITKNEKGNRQNIFVVAKVNH